MAKKKKKKKKTFDFNWLSSYVPGVMPTNSSHYHDHGRGSYVYSFDRIIPGPSMGYWDEKASGAANAFMEYTFAGPVELMAGKSTAQAGLLARLGAYQTFKVGLAYELGMDFAILGAVLTLADPADKWSGGLDEWGFFGGNDPNVISVSTGGDNPFVWGLKQGHLGFLFGG